MDMRGYILKSDSPSCGLQGVKVFDGDAEPARIGTGLFAAALTSAFPDLPIEEERRLADPAARASFLERVSRVRPCVRPFARAGAHRAGREPDAGPLRAGAPRLGREGDARDGQDGGGRAARHPAARPLVRRHHADARRRSRARRRVSPRPSGSSGPPTTSARSNIAAIPISAKAHHVVDVFLRGDAAARVPAVLESRRQVDRQQLVRRLRPRHDRRAARGHRAARRRGLVDVAVRPSRCRERLRATPVARSTKPAAFTARRSSRRRHAARRPPKTSAATTRSTRSIGSLLLAEVDAGLERSARRRTSLLVVSGRVAVRDRAEGLAGRYSDRRRRSRRRRAWRSISRDEAGITLLGFVRDEQPQHLYARVRIAGV